MKRQYRNMDSSVFPPNAAQVRFPDWNGAPFVYQPEQPSDVFGVILLATIILLGATGLFSQLILSASRKRQKAAPADKQTVRRSNQENELVQH